MLQPAAVTSSKPYIVLTRVRTVTRTSAIFVVGFQDWRVSAGHLPVTVLSSMERARARPEVTEWRPGVP